MTSTPAGYLRNEDYTLEPERDALRSSFRTFFERRCSSERVRAAEPLGWDEGLWNELAALRPVPLAVPPESGGDGAGLVELALVCEEAGRVAAPVPLVDTVVATRLLAAIDDHVAQEVLGRLLEGEIATIAFGEPDADGSTLTGAGAVAPVVLAWIDDALVLVDESPPGAAVPNLGTAPVAWRVVTGGHRLVTGAEARTLRDLARRDWAIAMGATLVGLGEAAAAQGVQYAKDRIAFGVPIGTFQSVAHPLVDIVAGLTGARNLVWRAAWLSDNDPAAVGALPAIAYVYAGECAERAGDVAMHTQGGFGYTLESDVQLYYRRAKAWPLIAGGREPELQRIADTIYGTADGGR